ncbi:3-isopropylmalate dehydratase small subunit [Desulfallas sp. Bu1-1]|uniref:3-isopropylmalate dehydratase small subunit n=1 Tax=Desulfallas sp. Bu1-1 TaxID=2787620 RepID=UPI0018A11DB4|nr:3-isopropylmalate dehydratase small subunit [Desulfallas sp. Bu1-1]MBF7084610.1 3-isopropylmalate dehydratase small subunit [Desulfallas sp. Bu1-1]
MKNGRVWKFGNDVDTDVIIPGRFLADWNKEPEKLGQYCFCSIDPQFSTKVQPGDIIVAGENFGCGSSRQAAPVAIKYAGIEYVIAVSFARIFYRNAINIGLPVLECPALVEEVKKGDRLAVELDKGEIKNLDTGKVYHFEPLNVMVQEILYSGGLVPYVRNRLNS